MLAVWNRYDRRIEEAARDLGADAKTTFREVTLPLVVDRDLRLLPVRLHAHLERLRPDDPASERLRGAASAARDRRAGRPAGAIRPDLYALGAANDRWSRCSDLVLLIVVTLRLRFRSAPRPPDRGGVRRRRPASARRRARHAPNSAAGMTVVVVSTGGTIAMRREPATGKLVPAMSGEELVEMLDWPEAPPIELDDFARVPSFDMHGELVARPRAPCCRARTTRGRRRRRRHARHRHDGGDRVPDRPPARLRARRSC